MNLGLGGKVALVTGGNKGLGAASAEALAAEGAKLFLTARDDQALHAMADTLAERYGVETACLAADLTEAEAADRVAAAAIERFGRLDILVNSAGAAQGGVFWDIPDRVWDDAFALKVMGTIRMMRAVVPAMRAQKSGRIVTIAGNTGHQPGARMLPSAAANAALLAVITGLAQEVAADGLVVLAVNPGPTRTARLTTLFDNMARAEGVDPAEVERRFREQMPTGRLGEPEEIGRLVAFLASDAAANMTGTSVTADGGATKGLA